MTGAEIFPNDPEQARAFDLGRAVERIRMTATALRWIESAAGDALAGRLSGRTALGEIRDSARLNAQWCEQWEVKK